ncbi:MAG: S-layer homology domain-containing protein, partial [Clostridia bacterium]
LEKLSERLAQSNLYKGLLLDLKPTVLVPIPEKSFARWQLKVEPEAWQEIRSRSSKISMIKGDWRTDMLPQRDVNGQVPLLLSLTMYDEKTQTDQISNLNSEVVPFTSSYRLTLSDQGAAAFAFRWPTETQQEELLPVLYFRTAETEPWGIQSTLVQPDADLQYVKGHFRGNGDLFVAGVPKPQFQDVAALPKAYDWAKEPIASLAALGIIQGRSAEQFDWQAHLKRSEAILLISRLTGKTVQTEGIPDFAANTAKPINRAELAWLLANAAESTGSKSVDAPHIFGDQQMIPDWAVQPIAFATGQKWLQGRTDGRFDPLAPLTRAEAVVALYRMMSLEPEVAVK